MNRTELMAAMVDEYNAGSHIRDIANRHETSYGKVRRILQAAGVSFRINGIPVPPRAVTIPPGVGGFGPYARCKSPMDISTTHTAYRTAGGVTKWEKREY